jgi:hypothetical protein
LKKGDGVRRPKSFLDVPRRVNPKRVELGRSFQGASADQLVEKMVEPRTNLIAA